MVDSGNKQNRRMTWLDVLQLIKVIITAILAGAAGGGVVTLM